MTNGRFFERGESEQAGGLQEISRGLSEATPPDSAPILIHPGGVAEDISYSFFWHPFRVLAAFSSLSGGIAPLRFAQPPANFFEPCRLGSLEPSANPFAFDALDLFESQPSKKISDTTGCIGKNPQSEIRTPKSL
jgi:hypothetical protein